jgi:hypothetical protein
MSAPTIVAPPRSPARSAASSERRWPGATRGRRRTRIATLGRDCGHGAGRPLHARLVSGRTWLLRRVHHPGLGVQWSVTRARRKLTTPRLRPVGN